MKAVLGRLIKALGLLTVIVAAIGLVLGFLDTLEFGLDDPGFDPHAEQDNRWKVTLARALAVPGLIVSLYYFAYPWLPARMRLRTWRRAVEPAPARQPPPVAVPLPALAPHADVPKRRRVRTAVALTLILSVVAYVLYSHDHAGAAAERLVRTAREQVAKAEGSIVPAATLADARRTLEEARAVLEAVRADHPYLPTVLCEMADVDLKQNLREHAEGLYRRCLADAQKPDVQAAALSGLGTLQLSEERLIEAEASFEHAATLVDRLEDEAVRFRVLAGLADLRLMAGRAGEAEALGRQLVEAARRQFGASSRPTALRRYRLAEAVLFQGRPVEAEPLLISAVAQGEDLYADKLRALNFLANLYAEQNRQAEAQQVVRRTLELIKQWPLVNDFTLADRQKATAADVLFRVGRDEEAYNLLPTAVTLFGAYADLDRFLTKQGLKLSDDGGHKIADPPSASLLAVAIEGALRRGTVGEAATLLAVALSPAFPHKMEAATRARLEQQAGRLALMHGRPAEAEPHLLAALRLIEASKGAGHPDTATIRSLLGQAKAAGGKPEEALAALREASAAMLRAGGSSAGTGANAWARHARETLLAHLAMLERPAAKGGAGQAELTAEAFTLVQHLRASAAARAVQNMSMRFAGGDDALADLVRRYQNAQAQRQALDNALSQIVAGGARSVGGRSAWGLDKRAEAVDALLADLDAQIRRDFPAYAELAAPRPLPLGDTQALLAADEALLVHAVGKERTWLLAVRRDRALLAAAPVGAEALSAMVKEFRTGITVGAADTLPTFRAAAAHRLYETLVAPAGALLEGARVLYVVPDGAAQSVSFPALLTAPTKPGQGSHSPGALRDLPWLAKRFATATLPAASALKALRQQAGASRAGRPFLGIGDPLLDDHPGGRSPAPPPAERASAPPRAADTAQLTGGGGPNLRLLRAQPSLPETAWELESIARALSADTADLLLRERAREPMLAALKLTDYRVIAFATHGLTAGDLPGQAEPALLLTPPADLAPNEDGLLRSGEIARLKLDADWVVLSACNTAASDGTPDAEGLSGLAKAFFYAGARTLLVSHWAVPSVSTALLTTDLFARLHADPHMSRAEAHRLAMLAVMNDIAEPEFAHPLFWAGFAVVGEGRSALPGDRLRSAP